jgi:uncharacterized protein (DUF983 family)
VAAGVSPCAAGLACRCPRCGGGRLYEGLLTVRARCESGGLDRRAHDSGDGAAAFVILAVGAVMMPLVFLVEFRLEPPAWAHLLWIPVVLGLTVLLLRPAKATLIALQYRHRDG